MRYFFRIKGRFEIEDNKEPFKELEKKLRQLDVESCDIESIKEEEII